MAYAEDYEKRLARYARTFLHESFCETFQGFDTDDAMQKANVVAGATGWRGLLSGVGENAPERRDGDKDSRAGGGASSGKTKRRGRAVKGRRRRHCRRSCGISGRANSSGRTRGGAKRGEERCAGYRTMRTKGRSERQTRRCLAAVAVAAS